MADTRPTSPTAITRALIRRLQADAAPVRRLWSPVARFGLWLAVVAVVGGPLGLYGLRPDLLRQLRDPLSLLELTLLAFAGMAAAILALRDAVPGRESSRVAPLLPLGLALAAVGLWYHLPMQADVAVSAFAARGLACATSTLLLAAFPWCALLIAVRRGAPPHPPKAGVLVGVAALVMGAVMMRLRCPLDERLHLLVWHALPVVGGALLSGVVGLVWLGHWSRARAVSGRAREGWHAGF